MILISHSDIIVIMSVQSGDMGFGATSARDRPESKKSGGSSGPARPGVDRL